MGLTLPSAVLRLVQVLEGLAHRHEDCGLHSELASGGGAGRGAVGVVPAGQGGCHCMVHIGHGLHDACCQGGYVQYRSHLQQDHSSGLHRHVQHDKQETEPIAWFWDLKLLLPGSETDAHACCQTYHSPLITLTCNRAITLSAAVNTCVYI